MRHLTAIVLLTAALAGCAPSVKQDATRDDALYVALGGDAGITRLTDAFLYYIAEDERVVERFLRSDIGRFRQKFIEQICALSGGPCTYKGDDMRRTHAGHDISEAEFNAVVENLWDAMEAQGYPVAVQNQLLALLVPMQEDIVRG